jgi:hypothetical protein
MMDLRPITEDDFRVLRALWGRNLIEQVANFTTVLNGTFNGQPACVQQAPGGAVFVYADREFGIPTLAHEIGHAIHFLCYPESHLHWSEEKCETFALLATANAVRQDLHLGFLPMTDEERRQFAHHARAVRAGKFRPQLRAAYKLAQSPYLSRQITEAAYGRPH